MGLNLFSSKLDPKGYNYCIAYIIKVIIFGTLDIFYFSLTSLTTIETTP